MSPRTYGRPENFAPTIVSPFLPVTGFSNFLQVSESMVARDGVEPPTPAFSGLRTTALSPLVFNNLTLQSGLSIVTIL